MSDDEETTRVWYSEKRQELKLVDLKTGEMRIVAGISKDAAEMLVFELSYQGELRAG